METILGILIGVIATIFISHYYYKRSSNKSLTPYLTLSTKIFSGIDSTVRKQLKFMYQNSEVEDIHQLEFLIANDGEKAITNCIEPLSLDMPSSSQVLDSVIVHKHPSNLKVSIFEELQEDRKTKVIIDFPLLNKGDFFLVKLLLSGSVNWRELSFYILSDDLPRIIKPKMLPPSATKKEKLNIEWAAFFIGILELIFTIGREYAMFTIWKLKPDLFPYPWSSFNPSISGNLLLIIWGHYCPVKS